MVHRIPIPWGSDSRREKWPSAQTLGWFRFRRDLRSVHPSLDTRVDLVCLATRFQRVARCETGLRGPGPAATGFCTLPRGPLSRLAVGWPREVSPLGLPQALRRKAAAGVDGVTWEQYRRDLEANLQDLHARLHRGAYRAKPSRRVFIPKADGQQRPLGIASLEDKIVQRVVAEGVAANEQETDGEETEGGAARSHEGALMRARHNIPVPAQGARLCKVLQGYFGYYAVWTNLRLLRSFRTQVIRAWMHALRRRSQRHRMSWGRMGLLVKRWIPPVRSTHPWPEKRFAARHSR